MKTKSPFRGRAAAFAAVTFVFVASAQAEQTISIDDTETIEEIVVHAHPLGTGDLAQSIAVLRENDIARGSGITIGDVLADTPGVQSASFGPGVGQPVIHGLSGTRVLVLENDQETMDMSTTPDHAVPVEPFLADRIEVLKGSSTLIYGSGAIGGAVDVHNNRMPIEVPNKTVRGKALLRGDGSSNGYYGGVRLDGGVGQFAWHADAYSSDQRDISIPGYASVDPFAEEDHEGEGEEEAEGEHHDEEEGEEEVIPVKGRLENSYAEFTGGALGGSFILDRGHIGVAVITRDWTYGIVGADVHEHHAHEEEEGHEGEEEEEADHEEEGPPWIELEQTRIQSQFGIRDPLPGVRSVLGGLTVSEYEHYELEGEGEVGSYYANDSWEGRILFTGEEVDGWEPAFGVQFGVAELGVGGDKASANYSESQYFAAMALAQKRFDQYEIETGIRIESVEQEGAEDVSRDYLATSGSLGAVFSPQNDWRIHARADYSMRAPRGDELFAENPHLSTQGFEIGDVELEEEESFNLELGAAYEQGPLQLSANVFRYAFDNYIYQRELEEMVEGLQVIEWAQSEATLVGGEMSASLSYFDSATGINSLFSLGFDMVSTDLKGPEEDHLPRSPANRLMLGGQFSIGNLWAKLAYTHVFRQDETASYERQTASYNNLDLLVEYGLEFTGFEEVTLFLSGRNLGDEEQRNHASFVKDVAPLPGRRVEAGVRVRF